MYLLPLFKLSEIDSVILSSSIWHSKMHDFYNRNLNFSFQINFLDSSRIFVVDATNLTQSHYITSKLLWKWSSLYVGSAFFFSIYRSHKLITLAQFLFYLRTMVCRMCERIRANLGNKVNKCQPFGIFSAFQCLGWCIRPEKKTTMTDC